MQIHWRRESSAKLNPLVVTGWTARHADDAYPSKAAFRRTIHPAR